MADDTDEENLDNQANTQPENPPGSNIPTNDPKTINLHQESGNMEVHHHPDIHHSPKKWKEYFLEFLMIFLAVTMGFFAESYREHLNDRSKEKEYIKSMVEDLETDSAFLELSINKLIPYHLIWLDSTMHLLSMTDLRGKDKLVYQAFMIGTGWSYNFHPTERTLSQLHTEDKSYTS